MNPNQLTSDRLSSESDTDLKAIAIRFVLYIIVWIIVAPICFCLLYFARDTVYVIPISVLAFPQRVLADPVFFVALALWCVAFSGLQELLDNALQRCKNERSLEISARWLSLISSIANGVLQSLLAIPVGLIVFSTLGSMFSDILTSPALRFQTCGLAALTGSIIGGLIIGGLRARREMDY